MHGEHELWPAMEPVPMSQGKQDVMLLGVELMSLYVLAGQSVH